MISFFLYGLVVYIGYSRSRYWPFSGGRCSARGWVWAAWLLALLASGLLVWELGWVTGLLVALCAYMTALSLVILLAVIAKHLFKRYAG